MCGWYSVSLLAPIESKVAATANERRTRRTGGNSTTSAEASSDRAPPHHVRHTSAPPRGLELGRPLLQSPCTCQGKGNATASDPATPRDSLRLRTASSQDEASFSASPQRRSAPSYARLTVAPHRLSLVGCRAPPPLGTAFPASRLISQPALHYLYRRSRCTTSPVPGPN